MMCEGSGLPYVGEECPVCRQKVRSTKAGEYPLHWNPENKVVPKGETN